MILLKFYCIFAKQSLKSNKGHCIIKSLTCLRQCNMNFIWREEKEELDTAVSAVVMPGFYFGQTTAKELLINIILAAGITNGT